MPEKKVLLDTNFLLIPFQFGVDIFTEIGRICPSCRLFVLDKSIDELEQLAMSALPRPSKKRQQTAKLALRALRTQNINTVPVDEPYVDRAILQLVLSAPRDWIVATQDKALRKALHDGGIACICMRQKKYLTLIP